MDDNLHSSGSKRKRNNKNMSMMQLSGPECFMCSRTVRSILTCEQPKKSSPSWDTSVLIRNRDRKQCMALVSLRLWSTFSVLPLSFSSSFRGRSFPSQRKEFKPLQQSEKCLRSFWSCVYFRNILLDYIQYIFYVLKNNHKFCLEAFTMVTKYPLRLLERSSYKVVQFQTIWIIQS